MKIPKIFLCHATEDKPQVRPVYKKLKSMKLDAWLDEEKLLPGQIWDQVIREELKDTDFIIVFFSSFSLTKRGYLQKEIKIALDIFDEFPEGNIFIIPVRLDDCKLPFRFAKFQYCDLFEPDGFQKIIDAIQFQLGSDSQINKSLILLSKEQSILADVMTLLENRKLSEAEKKLNTYEGAYNYSSEYWYWLSKIAFAKKNLEVALEYINTSLSKDENHLLSFVFKIRLLLIFGGKNTIKAKVLADSKYGYSEDFNSWVDCLRKNNVFSQSIITDTELKRICPIPAFS